MLSPLHSAFLPAVLLRAECTQEMLLSLLISPFHSLMLYVPFSSPSLPHSLSHSPCALAAPPPSSSLLSSSSYITDYVHVSCCSLVALCAVCNQWKGFPASVHKVEFTDGNAIHPSPQAPPSSPTIHPSFSRLCSMSSLNLFPHHHLTSAS